MQVKDKSALNFNEGQNSQKVRTERWELSANSHLCYKPKFINQLDRDNSREVWLNRQEGSHLLNITVRALIKRIKLNKIQSKIVYGNGGKQYRILLQSLPIEVQERYYREFLDKGANKSSDTNNTDSISIVSECLSANVESRSIIYKGIAERSTSVEADSRSILNKVQKVATSLSGHLLTPVETSPSSTDSCDTETASSVSPFLPASSSTLDITSAIYSKSPAYAKAFAERWLKVITDIKGLKGEAIDEYISNYNLTNDKAISRTQVYEKRKRYNENGLIGLLPSWGQTNSSRIDERLYSVFKSAYLKEGSPSVNGCYMQAIGQFSLDNNIDNLDKLPSAQALKRLLDKRVPMEAQYLARKGSKRYYRKFNAHINRDYSNLKVNEVWVSDHAQLDVAVSYIDDVGVERYGFPWITVFRDMLSGYWVGYELYIGNPNSDRIFSVFRKSALKYGVPNSVLFDNGKDYRALDFGGRRVTISSDDISKRREISMLDMLGVKVIYALPYNAQTKPVERDFRTIKEQFSKQMIGYRGGNIVERPEVLKDEVKSKKISTKDEMLVIFENYIKDVFQKQENYGKNNKGLSRESVFNSGLEKIRTISADALALFCMRISKPARIARNGVLDNKIGRYWGEWMAGIRGQSVYMRRDFDEYETAYIFDALTDSLLGVARLGAFDSPVFADDKVSKEQLKQAINEKNKARKRVGEYLSDREVADNSLVVARMAAAIHIKSNAVAVAVSNPLYEIMPNSMFEESVNKIKQLENVGIDDIASIKPRKSSKKVYKMFLNEE